ncbi:DUF58 domain-containing protein [Clostridium tarantellae]|uniref:DUF58 domain-containing protein n=1 Tax=Clostridium tarantellae TaxID=39493 RepID=A0A6I1MKR4_9CLOT|nr:DUF58 domain-containing protein [Clostridium tarantellae]MPQ42717.1 DUF58 domain-containing protein [Clostridium tarantellae]
MKDKIFDKNFFEKLNTININLNLRLSQGAQGGRKSIAKGSSVEFSDFREYMPGDDFRRIDWNAYGRFNKLFIKIFMEEREGVFNFFIDKSKSMDFGEFKKSYTSLQIVASLSYIVLNNLDRVYLNTLGSGEVQFLKGGSGKQIFQRVLKELSNIEFKGETDLISSIMKRNIKNKGVSIIISDFFTKDGLKGIEQAIKYLTFKKQQVILIQVLCMEEINPSYSGEVTLVDEENGNKIRMTLTPTIIKNYEEKLKTYNHKIEELAMKYGANFFSVSSNEPIENIILNNLTKKQLLY